MFILIFAAGFHEAMLQLEKHMELTLKPKFVSSDEGIMVLEVAPKSPAFQMGIQSGDLIVQLNDKKIESEEEILHIIKGNFNSLSFKIKKPSGEFKDMSYINISGNKRLGIVIVPRELPKDNSIVKMDDESFKDVLDKMKDIDKD